MVRKVCSACDRLFCFGWGEPAMGAQSKDEKTFCSIVPTFGGFSLVSDFLRSYSPAARDDVSQFKGQNPRLRKAGTGGSSLASGANDHDYGIPSPVRRKARGGAGYTGSREVDGWLTRLFVNLY